MSSFYIDSFYSRWSALAIFLFACFTDFLDGYLARTLSQTSRLGQALDPIADKLLVSAALLLLSGFGKISRLTLIPTIVILCREILVSGLREFLSEISLRLPVTNLAKWKTATQMLAISCLLLRDTSYFGVMMGQSGEILLWVAALMTLITGWGYFKISFRYF
jgi:cardiolipin synthase